MEMTDGYPFVFVMNDKTDADDKLLYTMQYRFKSTKSHFTYIVRVEKYINHCYCLKFYNKTTSESKNKYSLRTNTFEARTIFYTLYHIMMDVLNKDNRASFFFIGADDEKDEIGKSTRRYRIYRRFVSSSVSNNVFEHFRFNELSLYILVNRNVDMDNSVLADKIALEVRNAYGL